MLITIIKAFIIGATMMVPGVSGGSMAMILGIYEHLISALSRFRENKKQNFIFLVCFTISALVGILLLSKLILAIIDKEPIISMFFFMGLVLGSVPMIWKEASIDKLNGKDILAFLLGFCIVLLTTLIPEGLLTFEKMTFSVVIIHLIAGFVVSIGFILPGISFSYLLLVLGMYSFIMDKLSSFDILSLIPFGIGFVLGALVMVKAIDKALSQMPRFSYIVILGFLLGSLVPVFPGLPQTAVQYLLSIVLLLVGFFAIYFVGKKSSN